MNRLDERWDRLAAGELSEAEHDELRGLADATGEGYEAYQAFKPLGAAFQQNVAASILAQRRREEDAIEEAAAAAAAALAASQKMDLAAQPKVPERKGIFKWAGALAASTALVAGLLVFIPHRSLGLMDVDTNFFIGKPTRGPSGAVQDDQSIPQSGTRFQMVLRPRDDIDEILEAKAYLAQKNTLIKLAGEWSASPGGNFRLEGFLPYSAELESGDAELIGVYYRPGHEPNMEDIRAALAADSPTYSAGDWAWGKEPIKLRNQPVEPEE